MVDADLQARLERRRCREVDRRLSQKRAVLLGERA